MLGFEFRLANCRFHTRYGRRSCTLETFRVVTGSVSSGGGLKKRHQHVPHYARSFYKQRGFEVFSFEVMEAALDGLLSDLESI